MDSWIVSYRLDRDTVVASPANGNSAGAAYQDDAEVGVVTQQRMTAAEYRTVTAKPKGANATEAAFGEHLRMLHRDGIITEPKYHRVHDPKSMHLSLLGPCGKGKRTITFTPDWTFERNIECFVDSKAGIIPRDELDLDVEITLQWMYAVDVKGWQREDAWLKIRLAACLYPDIAFFIVKKQRGGWKWERVRGGKLGGEVDFGS